MKQRSAARGSSWMTLRAALWIILGAVALALLLKFAMGRQVTPMQTLVLGGFFTFFMLLAPLAIWFEWRARRRKRRDIREVRCEKCRYPLKDVPTETCPECGHDNSWRKME